MRVAGCWCSFVSRLFVLVPFQTGRSPFYLASLLFCHPCFNTVQFETHRCWTLELISRLAAPGRRKAGNRRTAIRTGKRTGGRAGGRVDGRADGRGIVDVCCSGGRCLSMSMTLVAFQSASGEIVNGRLTDGRMANRSKRPRPTTDRPDGRPVTAELLPTRSVGGVIGSRRRFNSSGRHCDKRRMPRGPDGGTMRRLLMPV